MYQCAPPGGNASGARGRTTSSRRSGSSRSATGARSRSSAPRPWESTSTPSGSPAAGRRTETRSVMLICGQATGMDLVEEELELAGRRLTVLRPPDAEALIDERAFEHDEFLPYWAELWPS